MSLPGLGDPWEPFLLFLLVFGVMPGVVLRIIVLAHPRDSGRRKELIAELYAVPRVQRPLWVAEQLELALTEGLVGRLASSPDAFAHVTLRLVFRSQIILDDLHELMGDLPRWYRPWWAARESISAIRYGSHRLESGVALNAQYPETFWIPDADEKHAIVPGIHVKLMFRTRDGEWGERMWVRVDRRRGDKLKGSLSNTPIGFPLIGAGDQVRFRLDDIIDIDWSDDEGEVAAQSPSSLSRWYDPGLTRPRGDSRHVLTRSSRTP